MPLLSRFDPWTLLNNMRQRATDAGVTILPGALQGLSLADSSRIQHAEVRDKDGHTHELSSQTYVVATGAWASVSGKNPSLTYTCSGGNIRIHTRAIGVTQLRMSLRIETAQPGS